MYTIYQLLSFFIIYACFGWCLEVVYQTVEHGIFINRGFLNGPYCPIYGFGVIIVVGCLNTIKENIFVLYIGSVILTSLLEFLTGFVLEKIFHQKWWDYTDEHFNIMGYVCLKFSLLWGIACLIVVRLIHPMIEKFVDSIPHTLGVILLIVIFTGFVSDIIMTVLGIMNIKKRLTLLENISAEMKKISDYSGEKLYTAVTEIRERNDEFSEKAEAKRAQLEELKSRYREAFEKKGFTGRRIENAFPKLKLSSDKSLRELLDEFKEKRNK